MSEIQLQRYFLGAITKGCPWLRLWRRMVGVAEVRGVKVSFGSKGQADLYGFDDQGHAYEIELKSATGRVSDDQERWGLFCVSRGVRYYLLKARPGEDRDVTVARWIAELKEGRS